MCGYCTLATGSGLAVADTAIVVQVGDRQDNRGQPKRQGFIFDAARLALITGPIFPNIERELFPVRRVYGLIFDRHTINNSLFTIHWPPFGRPDRFGRLDALLH